jgi:signal transduction histidine kinase
MLPLWDFAKQRWHSGLVIWSCDSAKLINVEDDMAYLKAFSNAVMNEVNRINLAFSDTAKATFLASISHELRSPLHGILGSIEFLHDTPMDDFQANMLISVETCGKTLLDTVNHVLDYAKINNLTKHNSRHLGHRRNEGKPQASSSDHSLTSRFNLAYIVEEVVEAVYAGQVFRSAQNDVMEGSGATRSSSERAVEARKLIRDNDPKASRGKRTPCTAHP